MHLLTRSALSLTCVVVASTAFAQADIRVKISRVVSDTAVELSDGKTSAVVTPGARFGRWTLMAILNGDSPQVVLEDFQQRDGRIAYVSTRGIAFELPKTAEPSNVDATSLYRGHAISEIEASDTDVLANELLQGKGDPTYAEVAAVFPPLKKIRGGTFSFIGTPDTSDKIGFTYGGRTANFDPAVFDDSIRRIRDEARVWHGLVGGYLPVMRFVYPDTQDAWTEMIAFAPFRISNGNTHVQPAWYRVTRVEHGVVAWSRYVDSYQPFPPRVAGDARAFYADLANAKSRWDQLLQSSMRVDIPDDRIANMARFSLVRAIMTRTDDFPHYGAVDKDYGGNEHAGFPDTFNVDTAAMVDWGLLDRAGRYIDNYFERFVRDDGSILYRGPETGQFGRMLTVLAQFANASGNRDLLVKHRARIDAITQLLLNLRARALELPTSDPAFGMLNGWSEADSALDPEPARYMQPYFSNSTEAARGFRDLGRVWQALGAQTRDPALIARGTQLIQEARALRRDIDVALARSTLTESGTAIIPAIAGVSAPFHIAVQRDRLDPQHRSYRTYMEMLHSGSLSATQVRSIVDYRANTRDVLLGIPTAYNYGSREVAGFLLYGHVYGLIQHDMIREALLATYSGLAHQYTRGMWMAPETRRPLLEDDAAPYCVPAQLIAPLLTRWLLAFEDPETEMLWLAKAVPREWLADGKRVGATGVLTRWGRIDFTIDSRLSRKSIEASIAFPADGIDAQTRLRLRAPSAGALKSVTLNGARWSQFDATTETIVIPANTRGTVRIVATY